MKLRTILIVAFGAALVLGTVSCKKDQKGFSGNPIDLGVSMRWADKNVGAVADGDAGTSLTYAEAVEYASQGRKWTIPTKEQWDDILDNESVKIQKTLDPVGFYVIGKDGRSIFFPAGQYLCAGLNGKMVQYYDMGILLLEPVFKNTENTEGKYYVRMVRK